MNNVGLSSLGDLGARRVAVRFSLAGGILAPQALAAFAILVFKNPGLFDNPSSGSAF